MRNLFRSRIFRYGVAYTGLFFLSSILVVGVFYFALFQSVSEKLEDRLLEEAAWLKEALSAVDLSQTVERLNFYIADHTGNPGVYLLLNAQGGKVAGNIDLVPEVTIEQGQIKRFIHQDQSTEVMEVFPEEAYPPLRLMATVVDLDQGYRLIVGHNFHDIDQIKAEVFPVVIKVLLFSLLMGLAVAVFLARRLNRRLEIINRSSLGILEGRLETRMKLTGSGDEFDHLSRNLNRMLDRIFYLMGSIKGVTDNIAHDLRSPLSRMRSRMEVALIADRSVDEYKDILADTVEDTSSLLTTFNALLTIASIESGAGRDDFQPLDLAKLGADTAEMYHPVLEETGHWLKTDFSGDLKMTGNPNLIIQALSNLLDNAIKYTDTPCEIVLTIRRHGTSLIVEVADAGPGIPAAFREKALQRFTRLDESRTRPGQGLGLSLVQVVAEVHGGTVRLEDAQPGLLVLLEFPCLDGH